MIKKLTKQWLHKKQACGSGIKWFLKQDETEPIKVINKLMKENNFAYANWLIVRLMNYKQYVSYAVFAAEQVIDIYENKYTNDNRPRLAIEAAKKCIKSPTKKNKAAASVAYTASAAYTAGAAAASVASASVAAGAAAGAKKSMQKRIMKHGIRLLGE